MTKLPPFFSRLFIFIAFLFVFAAFVNAQTSSPTTATTSLVVSPPSSNFEMKPGETIQKIVKITNNSDTDELIVRAFIADFIVEDDLGTPIKVDASEAGRYAASTWFTLDKPELVIPPKGQDQVLVLITAPQDALPGGHYTGVFFQPEDFRGQKTTISYTNVQVGSLFGITIAGDIAYDALIKEFSTTQKIYEFGPVSFKAVIENQSDTHIRPQASITIKNFFGKELETLTLEEVNIFPFTSRTLLTDWEQIWGLGRYTATLTAAYGLGHSVERTIYFWIMPWRLIIALLILLAVILVIYISVRRHLSHRRDNRDNEIEELKRRIVELENKR